MLPALKQIVLFLAVAFLAVSCISTGTYRFGGAFVNVQMPVTGKKIGVLDPRGPYGDAEARRVMYKALSQTVSRCPGTKILTEDGMNDRGEPFDRNGDLTS